MTKNTIVFTNFDTASLEKDDANNLFKTIKFRNGENDRYANIVNVVDSTTIEVDYIKPREEDDEEEEPIYTEETVFVVGQLVDNFHCISKDYIWTIGTAALQEVDRQLQQEKVKRLEIETKLDAIMTILQNNNLA